MVIVFVILFLTGTFKKSEKFDNEILNIIIPVRDREKEIVNILEVLEEILKNQNVKYNIYIIEQSEKGLFNKGMLLNIGFIESQKDNGGNYYLMNDVDNYPFIDDTIDYSLRKKGVRHIFGYEHCLGGIFFIDTDSYKKSNGFSNKFYGWGSEDTDFQNRIELLNIDIDRSNFINRTKNRETQEIYDGPRTISINDRVDKDLPNKVLGKELKKLYSKNLNNIKKDGLNTTTYSIKHVKQVSPEIKRILVDIK